MLSLIIINAFSSICFELQAIWKNLKDGSKISVNSEILSQEKNKYTIERPQGNIGKKQNKIIQVMHTVNMCIEVTDSN